MAPIDKSLFAEGGTRPLCTYGSCKKDKFPSKIEERKHSVLGERKREGVGSSFALYNNDKNVFFFNLSFDGGGEGLNRPSFFYLFFY